MASDKKIHSIVYDENYFNGNREDGYTYHTRFGQKVFNLKSRNIVEYLIDNIIDKTGQNILVCGCAFGYSVFWFFYNKYNSYGIDVSNYAINNTLIPIAERCFIVDCRDASYLDIVKSRTGISYWDYIIDEDLSTCLTDTEAKEFCKRSRLHCKKIIHLLSTRGINKWYNEKSLEEWKGVVDPQNEDVWLDKHLFE